MLIYKEVSHWTQQAESKSESYHTAVLQLSIKLEVTEVAFSHSACSECLLTILKHVETEHPFVSAV